MYLDLLHGWPGRDSAGTASEMEHCNRIPAAVGRVRKKRQRSVSKTERKKKQRRSATGPEDGGEERYGLGMEWVVRAVSPDGDGSHLHPLARCKSVSCIFPRAKSDSPIHRSSTPWTSVQDDVPRPSLLYDPCMEMGRPLTHPCIRGLPVAVR